MSGSEVQIEALHEATGSKEFSEREKVAIHLAEMMTLDVHSQSEAEFAQLLQLRPTLLYG